MSLDVDYKKYFKRLIILLQQTKHYNGVVNKNKNKSVLQLFWNKVELTVGQTFKISSIRYNIRTFLHREKT